MPILHPEPPADGPRLLAEHLGAVLQGPAGHRHGGVQSLERVRVADPHAAFHYGLDDLLAGGGLDRAQEVGWEYFVFDAEEPIGIGMLGYEPDGALSFEGMTSGPTVEATLEALRFAEEHEHPVRNRVTLRVLAIPALLLHALWLHGDDDHFVPIHDSAPLVRERLYTWPEIESALRVRAREVKAQHDAE